MKFSTIKSVLSGKVRIPASKSHTVRAAIFAALAGGRSVIRFPLDSADTRSAFETARALGATVSVGDDAWIIDGTGGRLRAEGQTIDVGNSGTTLYIALGVAALIKEGSIVFDGDEQIRKRSAANMLRALTDLGAGFESTNDGCCPITVRGTLKGGSASIECPTSQYLTSLLVAAPLAEGDTHIDVPLLYEQPYVEMTLKWLEELGVEVAYKEDYSAFDVKGGQSYKAFDKEMAGDFSSATFFLCAAAITGSELLLEGLDMSDPQGDKAVVDYLRAMGAEIVETDGGILVKGGAKLKGTELDLNATPDALPAMAVTAAFAEGETVLGNVPQARMKETDRIAVMAAELAKLGVKVTEKEDALVVEGGGLKGAEVRGHGDHRVVMAFAIAGLASKEAIVVDTAEAAGITFPNFDSLVESIGGKIERIW